MKLLIVAAAIVLLPAATPGVLTVPTTARADPAAQNAFRDREGCLPIPQQVAGEKREYRGTRLDQQPPAQLLLAVDRRVNGCREATIIRRDIGAPARR